MLSGSKYGNRIPVASAVFQGLKHIPKTAYENAFRKLLKILKLCVSLNGEYFEGNKKRRRDFFCILFSFNWPLDKTFCTSLVYCSHVQ